MITKLKVFKILLLQQKTNIQNKGSDEENLVTVMQITKMYWMLSTWIMSLSDQEETVQELHQQDTYEQEVGILMKMNY